MQKLGARINLAHFNNQQFIVENSLQASDRQDLLCLNRSTPYFQLSHLNPISLIMMPCRNAIKKWLTFLGTMLVNFVDESIRSLTSANSYSFFCSILLGLSTRHLSPPHIRIGYVRGFGLRASAVDVVGIAPAGLALVSDCRGSHPVRCLDQAIQDCKSPRV